MRGAVGASAADVGLRLVSQMLSTVLIARMLPPEDFGLAMLVLSVVGIMGAFVSLPFEEALTQRRRLSTGHLQAALFVSLAMTLASVLLALATGPMLARLAGIPEIALWFPLATLFLLGQGPGTVARALSRRHQKFVDMAGCQASSVVVSCVVAVGVAMAGFGILALVLQRMLPVLLYPVLAGLLAWRRRQVVMVRPRWNAARFGELFRFSWINLADVAVDYATPAVMTFMVNAHFGTVLLGQLNIAMRMVDPLRSAIGSVGHNLAFSILARLQQDRVRLGQVTGDIVANVAAFSVPAFLGLAVCAPVLLPLMVGPGWEAAVPMAQVLCVTAAISVPFRYFYSGYSALGKPEYGLAGSLLGLVALVAWLEIASRTGSLHAVAGALLASEAATALLAMLLFVPLVGWVTAEVMLRMIRIWGATVAMVVLLHIGYLRAEPLDGSALRLVAMIVTGLAFYPLLLFMFCRSCFDRLRIAVFSGGKSR